MSSRKAIRIAKVAAYEDLPRRDHDGVQACQNLDKNISQICFSLTPYSAGVPLMGRFKNQTQPNVIIDIYF